MYAHFVTCNKAQQALLTSQPPTDQVVRTSWVNKLTRYWWYILYCMVHHSATSHIVD